MLFSFKFGGLRFLLLAFLLIGLAACSSYPLNMSEQEWKQLSTAEQAEARKEQARLDQVTEMRRAEQARLRAEEKERERLDLERRKNNAAYGERVQCVFKNAEFKNSKNWIPAEPLGFDLVVGESQSIYIESRADIKKRNGRTGYAQFDGQTVSICRYDGSATSARGCVRLVGTTNDFARGYEQRVSSSEFVRGSLRCSLKTKEPLHRYR